MKAATLMQRSGRNSCAKCGSHGPLTVDHILPVVFLTALGLDDMKNKAGNLQLLCYSCNNKKGAIVEMSDWEMFFFFRKIRKLRALKKKMENINQTMGL
jgi:hypothetical protein